MPEQKNWLRDRMESTKIQWPLDVQTRTRILERLIEAETFEQFLHTRFIGKKRFSLEGGEATIAALDEIAERAAANGVEEIAIGMAHRGRLNVLANMIGKPLHQVFAEFEEAPDSTSNAYGSGDVKYHLGAHGTKTTYTGTPDRDVGRVQSEPSRSGRSCRGGYRPRPSGYDRATSTANV